MNDFNFQIMYISILDGIVNEYNNTYHSTIRMKPVDIKSNTYINKDPQFKIGGIVRI